MRKSQVHPEIWLHTEHPTDFRKLNKLPWLRFANECLGLGNMLIINFGICCIPGRCHSMLLCATPSYIPKYGYTLMTYPILDNYTICHGCGSQTIVSG